MTYQEITGKYDELKYNIFSSRYNAKILYKILMIIGMASLTGLLAQVKFYLPWTPVPVTGQTFAVLISGIFFGSVCAGFSQILYVAAGIAGIPWFAGAKAGFAVFAGPTGGYLFGFVLAGFLIGHVVDNYVKSRRFFILALLILIADYILIYGFGLLQLNLWYKMVMGTELNFSALLTKGLIPFIPGEIFKVVCAASIGALIMPKKDYR